MSNYKSIIILPTSMLNYNLNVTNLTMSRHTSARRWNYACGFIFLVRCNRIMCVINKNVILSIID